jgi:hypothetical protein
MYNFKDFINITNKLNLNKNLIIYNPNNFKYFIKQCFYQCL